MPREQEMKFFCWSFVYFHISKIIISIWLSGQQMDNWWVIKKEIRKCHVLVHMTQLYLSWYRSSKFSLNSVLCLRASWTSEVWCYTQIILGLRRLREENPELKARFGYTVSSSPACSTWQDSDTHSKQIQVSPSSASLQTKLCHT